ncbi:hypothetical protein F2Q69_00011281 [Brassica cretica]|uniref:Transmembrane protein n=1 Tax=Brassica cretica TaxID=69181 RepID=A0A8S9R3A3_BRACR|nr:hypothetical protein F2Q69_00011281 [Brassica cretica]
MMSSCCEDSSVNAMGIRGIPEKCDCEEELKEDVRKASNELKKLNVIMKVGFVMVFLGIVTCLVLIMFDRANGLSLNSY